MPSLFDEAWEEAIASNPPNIEHYFTLELRHYSFDQPVRVVTGVTDNQTLRIEADSVFNPNEDVVFTACPFWATWPEQAEKTPPRTNISIDGVTRELLPYIVDALTIRADLQCLYREYRSDVVGPVYGPVAFLLKNINMSGTVLTGTAEVANISKRKFPSRTYNVNEFPSMLP
jgi:hypothetical protein